MQAQRSALSAATTATATTTAAAATNVGPGRVTRWRQFPIEPADELDLLLRAGEMDGHTVASPPLRPDDIVYGKALVIRITSDRASIDGGTFTSGHSTRESIEMSSRHVVETVERDVIAA